MIGTSSLFSFTPVLQQGLDLLFQYGLGLCAYQLANLLSVLEEQDGGDVADAELYCQLFVLLDVAFADDDLAVILLGKFADDRSQHAARTAPCCPEIYY